MEEKKTIKISLSTFFLILAIIVICVMGYFMYKVATEKEVVEKQITMLNGEIDKLETTVIKETEQNTAEKQEENTTTNVIENNSYDLFKQNYENAYNKVLGNNAEINVADLEDKLPGLLCITVDNNGNAYGQTKPGTSLNATYGNKYQIDSDVVNVYVCNVGNGSVVDAIFIHKDGTASKISGSDTVNGRIVLEKIENAKDIISVISVGESDGVTGAGGNTYYLVDINGNIIK